MKAKAHFRRIMKNALSPLIQISDRILLANNTLVQNSKWPVQYNTQKCNCSPFFIVGFPRGGSTLLRTILSRHRKVFIPPENGAYRKMIRAFALHRKRSWETVVSAVLREFSTGYEFSYWKMDLQALEKTANVLPMEERTLAGLINLIYREYGLIHAPGKSQWGDKTVPGNAAHLWKVDLIFPDSKYIHLVRDGRDSVASCVKAGFFDQDYTHAAYRWKDTVRECRKFARKINNKNKFFEIKYEDLVSSSKEKVSALCEFLGLEPSQAMLGDQGVGENVSDVNEIQHHENVKKPIFSNSIGKWKDQLPKSELHSVLRIIKKELALFGYE